MGNGWMYVFLLDASLEKHFKKQKYNSVTLGALLTTTYMFHLTRCKCKWFKHLWHDLVNRTAANSLFNLVEGYLLYVYIVHWITNLSSYIGALCSIHLYNLAIGEMDLTKRWKIGGHLWIVKCYVWVTDVMHMLYGM